MDNRSFVFSMIGGGISALVVQLIKFWLDSWRDKRQKQRIASMVVASGLREWMTASSKMVYDMNNFWTSGGMGGKVYRSAIKFRFTDNVEIVANLESKIAVEILALIHRVSVVNGEIDFEDEFGGDQPDERDIGIAILATARIADLYLCADKIYTKLAERIGWHDQISATDITAFMQERVKQYKEFEEKRSQCQGEI